MFDDNEGDDLEDREFLESFVADEYESPEEDNNALETNLGIEETQNSNLTEDSLLLPSTRQLTSVSTASNTVRSLPFTRQASSISSSSNIVSASILNPANVSVPVSLPVVRRGTRSVPGAQTEVQSFNNIFMQSMLMNQARWEEERRERAEERERREEQRLIREQERERERERDRQSFMQMMAMMMNNSSKKTDDERRN